MEDSPDEFFMGVDLTTSPRRVSLTCILSPSGETVFHEPLLDDEIVGLAERYAPACIAVDAPLTLPTSLQGRGYRLCDREVRRMGIRIFPLSLGSMRMLALRGVGLAARLRGLGFEVIETFPSGAQRVLGLWGRGGRKASVVARGLRRLGLKIPRGPSLDMIDAATCAYVALLYRRGLCMVFGDPSEGLLYLPAKSTRVRSFKYGRSF
ncbi:MAG: DUF429 domain-containing protein [Nitrososphaerota archaeon]